MEYRGSTPTTWKCVNIGNRKGYNTIERHIKYVYNIYKSSGVYTVTILYNLVFSKEIIKQAIYSEDTCPAGKELTFSKIGAEY